MGKVKIQRLKMSEIFHPVFDWWLKANIYCELWKISEHDQKPLVMQGTNEA